MKELDKTDRGILKLLEQDGTLTHKEIAYRLHKTVNPIHARIRSLEKDGYIKKSIGRMSIIKKSARA
jgi:Lrp/AsnC family leucine-responsive transcriptional regulator